MIQKKQFFILLVIAIASVAVVPAFAHRAPPCADCGEPVNSDNAQHHIRLMAQNGDIGKIDHDGDGVAHTPGSRNGFPCAIPAGNKTL